MITVRGKIENGAILTYEPIDEKFEGQEVEIVLPDDSTDVGGTESEPDDGWEELMAAIERNQVSTGIGDLAHQHDHYLYGTPKRED